MEKSLRKIAKKNENVKRFLLNARQPGYTIQRHPRFLNPPLSCQMGVHKGLINKFIGGVLHLYCTKCGRAIAQGIHDKTWTKNEIHKIKQIKVGRGKPRTKEETLRESWEAMEMLRKRFTDKEIKELIEKRRRGLR